MLKFSTGVILSQDKGQWAIRIRTPKGVLNLADALGTYRCTQNTSGVRLAQIVVQTLNTVVQKGRAASLQPRAGKTTPLITLKEFLCQIAGPCTTCRGKGCASCNGTGVS